MSANFTDYLVFNNINQTDAGSDWQASFARLLVRQSVTAPFRRLNYRADNLQRRSLMHESKFAAGDGNIARET